MEHLGHSYIGQQLKNLQYRKKNNRRVSSIMTQIRIQSTESELQSKNRLQQLYNFVQQFQNQAVNHNPNHSSKSKNKAKKTSIFADKLVLENGCKRGKEKSHLRALSQQFRIKKQEKLAKCSRFNQNKQNNLKNLAVSARQSQTVQLRPILPNQLPITKTPRTRPHANPNPPPQPQFPNLQQQNYHKLNSFIRGGYDLNQFSSVINLSQLDQYRKNYYVFDKLYNQVAELNLCNKMTLRDVRGQTLRDVVFLNQQKDHSIAPEFRGVLRDLGIVR